MKTEQINKVAQLINELSDVNIFENRRTRKHTEARSLLNFILKNHFKMTLYDIKNYYIAQGKSYDHATALFSLKNFEVYKKYSKNLNEWFNIIKLEYNDYELMTLKRETIKHKVDYISDDYVSRIYNIVDKLPVDRLAKK